MTNFVNAADWATARVYELEASPCADAAGLGPTITGGTYGAAKIGNGLSVNSTATVATAPGIDLSGATGWFIGFWRNTTGATTDNQLAASIALRSDDAEEGGEVVVNLFADPTNGNFIVIVSIDGNGYNFAAVTLTDGFHHFFFIYDADDVEITLYIDGVLVEVIAAGTSAPAGSNTTEVVNSVDAGGTGRLDQVIIGSGSLATTPLVDIGIIYNAGSGLAYTSWPSPPTGGRNSLGTGFIFGY